MRTSPRRAAVALATLGLLVPATPPAHAASERLVTKTVKIGQKPVRFVLAVDNETASVRMQFRKDGRWRTVAADQTECRYTDASYEPSMEVQKETKQVLVSWFYDGGRDTSEYGGYDVRNRKVDMFGANRCP